MNPFKPIIDLFSRYITLSPDLLNYRHPGDESPFIDEAGWLHGKSVIRMPAHESWYGAPMKSGVPIAIVWHYTCTKPGTAKNMAKNRMRKRNPATDRAASWHFTIDTNGTIVQMISAKDQAWHCAKGAIVLGIGQLRREYRVNACAVGIELVSLTGEEFTDAQEEAAFVLVAELKERYPILRENADRDHSEFDPKRRRDAGPVWDVRRRRVLEKVYGPL